MKDQNPVGAETPFEKWDRARTLMLELLHKPDKALTSCAHNQLCYHELMEIKDQVIDMVRRLKNPIPLVEPTLEPPVNEDGSKSYEFTNILPSVGLVRIQ